MYLAAFSCFLIHFFFTKRVKEERRQQKLVERHVCQVCKPLNELINKQGWPCALSKTLKWTHLHFSSFTFIRQPDPADDLKQNENIFWTVLAELEWNVHQSIALWRFCHFDFGSKTIGWFVGSQGDRFARHLLSTLKYVGRLRLNVSSDRDECKRHFIEQPKSYRTVCR